MKLIYIWAALWALLAALLPLVGAADYTAPDTTEIQEVRVWRHMLEPNDVLIIVRYNISYGNASNQPYLGIDDTFSFTYTGTSVGNVTTTLGNVTAYPFFNNGYSVGLAAFYWADADPLKPDWGDLGNVSVTGSAGFGASPPSGNYTLADDDWTNSDAPSTQREDLRQWLINALIFCEMDWNNRAVAQGYTDRQYTLTATLGGGAYQVAAPSGEAYLGLTIDNITTMCPLLFATQLIPVTHTERDWQLTQQNAFEALHGNDTVGDTQQHLSNLLGGIGRIWASTLVILVGCLGLIILCTVWNRLLHGLLIAYVIILYSTPEGLFQMGLMALFVVIAVLYLSNIFLSKEQQ